MDRPTVLFNGDGASGQLGLWGWYHSSSSRNGSAS